MGCCSGADISKADRKRPREIALITREKRKKMNVAGGDFGGGGVGTDMAEQRRSPDSRRYPADRGRSGASEGTRWVIEISGPVRAD